MKNLFYFVLGLCLIILTSATTVSTMIVKPDKPKSTVIEITRYREDSKKFIYSYIKKGYIVKSANGDGNGNWLIIMEKY